LRRTQGTKKITQVEKKDEKTRRKWRTECERLGENAGKETGEDLEENTHMTRMTWSRQEIKED
jgi:hypothetical protein